MAEKSWKEFIDKLHQSDTSLEEIKLISDGVLLDLLNDFGFSSLQKAHIQTRFKLQVRQGRQAHRNPKTDDDGEKDREINDVKLGFSPSILGANWNKPDYQTQFEKIHCHKPHEFWDPPVVLFSETFSTFYGNLQSSEFTPAHEDGESAIDLMSKMSIAFAGSDSIKVVWNNWASRYFEKQFESQRTSDSFLQLRVDNISALLATKEDKLTDGGDALIQNIGYYVNFWREMEGNQAAHSYRPSFLLEQQGTNLSISGAISKNSVFVVDHFVSINLLSSPYYLEKIIEVAKVLRALKEAFSQLEKEYKEQDYLKKDFKQFEFPIYRKTNNLTWTYKRQLERERLVFEGTTSEGLPIIIKFSLTYSPKAHALCYESGIAPELLGYQELTSGWKMIVMEKLRDDYLPIACQRSSVKEEIFKKIQDGLHHLHQNNFVHGDLRDTNVFLDSKSGQVKFLDFDWSGEDGKAVYPSFLNPDVFWHSDVKFKGKVKKEHDVHFLEKIRKMEPCQKGYF